jgi:hypothetical protein
MNDAQFLGELLYRAFMADVISIGECKEACERIGIPYPPNIIQRDMYIAANCNTSQTHLHA